MEKFDTHYYDFNLINRKNDLNYYLSKAEKVEKQQKISSFLLLRNELFKSSYFGVNAQRNFDIILNDYYHTKLTYDNTNQLWVCDLLYICSKLVEKYKKEDIDFLDLCAIQFDEMSSGMCVQGRTHRLFQIVSAYEEYLKECDI